MQVQYKLNMYTYIVAASSKNSELQHLAPSQRSITNLLLSKIWKKYTCYKSYIVLSLKIYLLTILILLYSKRSIPRSQNRCPHHNLPSVNPVPILIHSLCCSDSCNVFRFVAGYTISPPL